MFTQSASDTLGLAQLDLAQIPRQIPAMAVTWIGARPWPSKGSNLKKKLYRLGWLSVTCG